MRGGGPFGAGLPLRELQLTDAQQQQIRDIRSRHETEIREATSRVEAARNAQRKAVETIPANEAQITALTQDLVELFHYLTGRSLKRDYQKLLVAPVNMMPRFLEMIERETAHARAGRPARIVAKMNALNEPQ